MFKYRRITGILLIILLLLTGIMGIVYAADNTDTDEKTITEEEVKETNEKSNYNTGENSNNSADENALNGVSDDNPAELRNGDLTKDSKYPFYDEVNSLSEETKNIILNINKNFEKEGAQIGVVVLNSLNGDTVEEKANKIFNTWGLGSKERNDGALLLVAINDRKFRLEVGDGLRNTVLSDYEAKEIIDKMIPYFKKEAYDLGINVALFEIDQKFYKYRDYLSEASKREETKQVSEAAALSSHNKSNKDTYEEKPRSYRHDGSNIADEQNYSLEKFLNVDYIVPIMMGAALLLFLVYLFLGPIFESISGIREEKREAKEEEERVRQFGQSCSFSIIIKDQHGQTKTMQYTDYSRKRVNKDEILNGVKSKVLNNSCFGDDVIDYTIESIKPNIDNIKCKDVKDVEITIKTVGQEAAFENDKDRVKITKDFYNSLTKEERDFYRSRANANMEKENGTNIWFYLYLYMLLKSDKQKSFTTAMRGANIPSDRFYKAPDINQDTRSSYNDSNNSSDVFDTLNALNSLNSTFGGDNSSGSSFGGFGGGSSSGGGASGGW